MEFADIPLKCGKHEAQVATRCLIFSLSWLSLEDDPSKHFLFLSFQIQIDQTSAKNESFHIILLLFYRTSIFQYLNKDGRELGRGPL